MSILGVLQLNKSELKNKGLLRTKSEIVTDFGDVFQREIDDVLETFYKWKIAVGLSAVQVGILKQFGVVNLDKTKPENTFIIVNPQILSENGKKDIKKESCLSIPSFRGDVERRSKIHFKYQNRFGDYEELVAEGFFARVIMHEIDHMNGILYSDRLVPGKQLEEYHGIIWE